MTSHLSRLRYAMVGGGQGAFIGGVHRHAMALDGQFELVAGAFSADAQRARASGQALGLPDDRVHGNWRELLADELRRPGHKRVDLVVIVAPNDVHYPVARAFVEAGFHVVCDKPLVHTAAQAAELVGMVRHAGTVFAVTYNYTGYPMVRQARHMVAQGLLGQVRKVTVEYNQGWLAGDIASVNKQARWRGDPARSGGAGAIADIGSHAENLVSAVTGLRIESLCADLTSFVPGRAVDDDANVLLRFESGARGVLCASQICAGVENGLRLRVSGTAGTLEWAQEQPSQLHFMPADAPRQLLTRGSPWLCEAARSASRLPAGHPEGFIEAFANIYTGVAAAIRRESPAEYPTVEDGARGVRFIETVLASAAAGGSWTPLPSAS